MWVSTSKGRTVRQPSATDLVGAMVAMAPDEAVVLARDLMHFVYVVRRDASSFVVWVRDGSLERQVRMDRTDARDAAAALVAFATRATFTREIVDALKLSAAA